MKQINRRDVLSYAAGAGLALSTPSWAQGHYPDKPIKFVVAFGAGGGPDIFARVLGTAMSPELKQPVVVENRPGATGHLAGEYVARSAPDGYTLLVTASSAQAVSLHLLKLNYKPAEDITPVALITTVPNVLVVHKDLPVRSVVELIAYCKANPGKVAYGSYGLGSNYHLAGEMLANMAGLDLVHVPYNSPQVNADLLANRIQLVLGNATELEQHINSGALRALAVTSPTRAPEFPNLPTVAETLPGFSVWSWAVLMAPAKTPREILVQLNAAARKAIAKPEVLEVFAKNRGAPGKLDLAQTQEFVRMEQVRWEKVIRDAKVPMLN